MDFKLMMTFKFNTLYDCTVQYTQYSILVLVCIFYENVLYCMYCSNCTVVTSQCSGPDRKYNVGAGNYKVRVRCMKLCTIQYCTVYSIHCVSGPVQINNCTRKFVRADGCAVEKVRGMAYNPIWKQWSWTNSTAMCYGLHARKCNTPIGSQFTKYS